MAFKSGFISIIGRPNVGKSSLLNQIIGSKISIVTNKPQTTRHNVQGILTAPQKYQLIFVDTPGIHTSRKIIDSQMNSSIFKSLRDSDLILFVVPSDEKIGKNDLYLFQDIIKKQIPFLIALSKKDLVPNNQLEIKIKEWQKIVGNQVLILPISIYEPLTIDKLIKELLKILPANNHQYFGENVVTNQSERQRTQDLIRQAILFKTGQEVPHNTLVIIKSLKFESEILDIDAAIIVERNSQKGIIIGHQGKKIKDIKYAVRKELKKLYPGKKIDLHLMVAVKKNWRNSLGLIKKETDDKGNF